MANPALEGLLNRYQSLGVAQSTRRTYQAGVRALQQFCTLYAIAAFPALPLNLRMLLLLLHGFPGVIQEHQSIPCRYTPRTFRKRPTKDELLHLLCTGIKRSQDVLTHTRLPITINVL